AASSIPFFTLLEIKSRVSSPEDGAKSRARSAPTPIPTANVVYLLDHLLWLMASVLYVWQFLNRRFFDKLFNACAATGISLRRKRGSRDETSSTWINRSRLFP